MRRLQPPHASPADVETRSTPRLSSRADDSWGEWVREEHGGPGALAGLDIGLAAAGQLTLDMVAAKPADAGVGDHTGEVLAARGEVFCRPV